MTVTDDQRAGLVQSGIAGRTDLIELSRPDGQGGYVSLIVPLDAVAQQLVGLIAAGLPRNPPGPPGPQGEPGQAGPFFAPTDVPAATVDDLVVAMRAGAPVRLALPSVAAGLFAPLVQAVGNTLLTAAHNGAVLLCLAPLTIAFAAAALPRPAGSTLAIDFIAGTASTVPVPELGVSVAVIAAGGPVQLGPGLATATGSTAIAAGGSARVAAVQRGIEPVGYVVGDLLAPAPFPWRALDFAATDPVHEATLAIEFLPLVSGVGSTLAIDFAAPSYQVVGSTLALDFSYPLTGSTLAIDFAAPGVPAVSSLAMDFANLFCVFDEDAPSGGTCSADGAPFHTVVATAGSAFAPRGVCFADAVRRTGGSCVAGPSLHLGQPLPGAWTGTDAPLVTHSMAIDFSTAAALLDIAPAIAGDPLDSFILELSVLE